MRFSTVKRMVRVVALSAGMLVMPGVLFAQLTPPAIKPGAAPAAVAPAQPNVTPSRLPKEVRVCKKEDIHGIWKLQSIAEDPPGPSMENFYRAPQQFIWFRENNMFGEQVGIQAYADHKMLMEVILRNETQALLQYNITEKGVIYIYKNRIPTDGLFCALVTKAQDPYQEGDAILFANEKNPTRLMKLYRKIATDAKVPDELQSKAPAPPPQENAQPLTAVPAAPVAPAAPTNNLPPVSLPAPAAPAATPAAPAMPEALPVAPAPASPPANTQQQLVPPSLPPIPLPGGLNKPATPTP